MKASEVLATAQGELGVREEPPGSNRVKYNTDYYGRAVSGIEYPWCVVFLWWCFRKAGGQNLFFGGLRTASCSMLASWAKQQGRYITKDFHPGDVVFLNFSGKDNGKRMEHCGLVKDVRNGSIVTYEGNTGLGNDANGGQVQQRQRDKRRVVGAYRPDYEEEDMSGAEIYRVLSEYCRGLDVPEACREEFEEAVAMGITNGANPCQLMPRYQAALMALRAAKAAKK